jgi:hypothetical protein
MTDLWTGNKGEWSEAYVFLRLLQNPLIPAGDYSLEAIGGKYYVAKSITLPNAEEKPFFPIQPKYESKTGKAVTAEEISEISGLILEELKSSQTSAFSIPKAQNVLERLGLSSMKTSSAHKVDIQLELPSLGGGKDLSLGFSIKSQLGSASSLLNHSNATSIKFEAPVGYTFENFRTMADPNDLIFRGFSNDTFQNNLEFFGSDFPAKLAELVKHSAFLPGVRTLDEELTLWAGDNGGPLAHEKIKFQMKSFLRATALGMQPSRPWAGDLEGYGGYLVVKKNGGIMCLHLEHDDDFKSYLLKNSRFENPASGRVSQPENVGTNLIAVPLQIRFLK